MCVARGHEFEYVSIVGNVSLSASSESIYQIKYNRNRGNSIRHRSHRVSSRRNKENGSGSFRRKNSLKKANTSNDNAKTLSSSNNGANGDKILKVNFQNNSPLIDSAQNKSHVVSFGEMPTVVKVTPKTKSQLSIPMEQTYSRKSNSHINQLRLQRHFSSINFEYLLNCLLSGQNENENENEDEE